MSSLEDGPHVRVGHAEREQAVQVLQQASVEGRLTAEELDERLAGALRARTRGDLHALLADVAARGPLDQMLTGRPVARDLGAGYTWEDPLVITAKWDSEKRVGPWEIPPFLELNAVAGDVKLNCVDATFVSLLIDVVVHGGAGSVVLVVPEGWGVDASRVRKGMGSVKVDVEERAHPGFPQLMLRGHTSLGDLKVRYPGRIDTWERDRTLRRLEERRQRTQRALGR